jgi:hypothetical protein
MKRIITFARAATVAALTLAGTAHAQSGQAPPGYNEQMIVTAGQVDALAVYCGKMDQSAADQHKARLRARMLQKGVGASTFDRGYASSFDAALAQAKSNPVQAKAACQRVQQMGAAAARQP